MDGQRFDELVKRFCTTRLTRVSMIRGLAGGAAAVLVGARQTSLESDGTALAASGTCREVGHPCQGNQDCCPNIESCERTGPGNARRCTSQTDCGALGQPCCNGDCQENLECDETQGPNGTCIDPDEECGEVGEPCCTPGDTCLPGGVCDTEQNPDVCVACGDEGEPCCTNNTCNTTEEDPLTCSTGGETDGTCVACGQIGEPCCEGDFCEPDSVCDPAAGPDGICVACGAAGEPCCDGPGDGCDGELVCNANDICEPPGECGALGQPCCDGEGDGCDGDLVCDTSQNPPDGICVECIDDATCGANSVCCTGACFAGECCGNEDCVGNETCNANHQCVGPTPPPGPDCPADAVLIGGRCVFLGLRCKTNETPLKCCFRAVAKGCRRKQQSSKARKNCLQRGKKRCKRLLTGV